MQVGTTYNIQIDNIIGKIYFKRASIPVSYV